MRKARVCSFALALGFVLSGCSAGSAGPSGAVDSGSPGQYGEIQEIVMQYPTLGNTPQDLKRIEDAVNARIEPEIGVRISFYPVVASELSMATSLMLSSDEQLDIVMCGFGVSLDEYVNRGVLIELDALVEEYGQSIVEAEGIAMSGGYFGGKLYALPSEEKMGRVRALFCRKDILDKYGITYDAGRIYTYEDIDDIFAVVRAGEGSGFYCLAAGPNDFGTFSNFDIVDRLGATLASGCLAGYGQGERIVNYYASEAFEHGCRVFRNWYEKGYLNPDCSTTTDSSATMMQSGGYFSFFNSAEPDMRISQSEIMQGYIDTELVPLFTSHPYAVTQIFSISMWGIAAGCQNPIKALQWLDLLYRDAGIANILSYGLEGVHYEFADDGGTVIRYPEGVDNSTVSYRSMLHVWGDKNKRYVREPLDESYYLAMDQFNHSILPEHTSRALGYCFDPAPVRDLYNAVKQVIDRYETSLRLGILDLDAALPEFLGALEAAGIDRVIAENQRQFDAWHRHPHPN